MQYNRRRDAGRPWEGYLARGLERMWARGELAPAADPATLAATTLASIQGGLLLTQTRRSARPLRLALDAALAYLRSFATTPEKQYESAATAGGATIRSRG